MTKLTTEIAFAPKRVDNAVSMKAITIHQPFAAQIIDGAKTREFRSWSTSYRGPLLIHAAKTRGSLGDTDDADDFYFASILGVVDVIDCEPTADGFAWVLANPRAIDPIDFKGKQGFFNVPVESLAERFPDVSWLLDLQIAS